VLALSALGALLAAAAPASAQSAFEAGVTHTEFSLDPWGDPLALERGKAILSTVGPLQNQHIMGFGAGNPEPSPGEYRWGRLDERVALIRETAGTPVITLCCAPDWMKGGRPGHTNWSRLEVAPRRRHFGDFAALAVAVAARYRDVRHFQVWNELKGFWDERRNRWDYEAYTDLYNTVYDALKAYDPTLAIGGPYAPMDSWSSARARPGGPARLRGPWGVIDRRSLDAVRYWLAHKHGAEFIAVDGHTSTNDGTYPGAAAGAGKFAAIDRWLRRRTSLPIWWSEFYAESRGRHGSPRRIRAALDAMRRTGAATALLWQPECRGAALPCLWSSTRRRDGGSPTAYLPILRDYRGSSSPVEPEAPDRLRSVPTG
jgi:hypothetical protein